MRTGRETGTRADGRRPRLLRLAYLSRAARDLCPAELGGLEASCRRRNAAAGFSGLLFCHGYHYFGLLEGPEPILLKRMEAIATDPRHHRLRILREQEIGRRRFVGWRMFQLPPNPLAVEDAPAMKFFVDFARRLT